MPHEKLLDDNRALPPVVGVILMVGITVVLAPRSPRSSSGSPACSRRRRRRRSGSITSRCGTAGCNLSDGSGDGVLTISHESGTDIDPDRVTIRTGDGDETWIGCGGASDVIDTTSEVRVRVDDDQTVRVVWTSADGERSTILSTWTGPDA